MAVTRCKSRSRNPHKAITHFNVLAVRVCGVSCTCRNSMTATLLLGVDKLFLGQSIPRLNSILITVGLFVCLFVCLFWCDSPHLARASSFTRFLYHTQLHTTVGRTPLVEWTARRKHLYITTHNTHNRKSSMPRRDSNPQSQQKRPQTCALDRAATATGC